MRNIITELAYIRSEWQWRLMQTGIPALLVATEIEDMPGIADAVCYEYKMPLRDWLTPAALLQFLMEMEAGAREFWV